MHPSRRAVDVAPDASGLLVPRPALSHEGRCLYRWLVERSPFRHGAIPGPVQEFRSRAPAVLVCFENAPPVFVKRMLRHVQPQAGALPRDELSTYELLGRCGKLQPLAAWTPALIGSSPGRSVLVTEGIGAHRPMGSADLPADVTVLGDALAGALVRIHAVRSDGPGRPPLSALPAPVPFHGEPSLHELSLAPGRHYELYLAGLQRIARDLDEVAAGWTATALVHGDLKEDNVLLPCRPAPAPFRLVDLEAVGWGDPLWDVGSLIGSVLFRWLRAMPLGSAGGLLDWIAAAAVPLQGVRAFCRPLLRGYLRDRSPATRATDQARAFRYAGLFLVHRAARAVLVGRLDGVGFAALTVGTTLVSDPAAGERILA